MGQGNYPVDNNTYNLLQVITSKLESIEAYQRYSKDADEKTRSLFEECKRSDEEAVKRALEILRSTLGQQSGQQSSQQEMAGVR